MADLYRKGLMSERQRLWATCRLKGLARDTPERLRIAELDKLIADHAAKSPAPVRASKTPTPRAAPAKKPKRPPPSG